MGTTIGNIVISYDIDSMHTEVKDALKEMAISPNLISKVRRRSMNYLTQRYGIQKNHLIKV